jgi:hypothetical protein
MPCLTRPFPPSNHRQPSVSILDPLIKPDVVASPSTHTISKFRLQNPPPINQSDIPRTRSEIATPGPPHLPIRIRQTRIQIKSTLTMVAINITAVRNQRAPVVF